MMADFTHSPGGGDGKQGSVQHLRLRKDELSETLGQLDSKLLELQRRRRATARGPERAHIEEEILSVTEEQTALEQDLEKLQERLRNAEEQQKAADSHAYVPGYSYDVCISFSDVDDQAMYGVQEGWVSRFISDLRGMLGQKLGGLDLFSLWSAHQLPGNASLNSEIERVAGSSATLVVILSQPYLFSEECQRQTSRFLQMVSERHRADSRVFVVERDRIEEDERPSEFKNIPGYKFWIIEGEGQAPRPLDETIHEGDSALHYDSLNYLSDDLVKELKRLKQFEQETPAEPAIVSSSLNTVFLAEATDDLHFQREEVRRYLEQFDIDVVPQSLYPREPKAFKQAVQTDMARSDLFVQLLSSVPFKLSPDLPEGCVRCQYTMAREAGQDVLQWRSPSLELNAVQDAGQREFLGSESVLAVTLEEFKKKIVDRLSAPPHEELELDLPVDERPLIFVHADPNDADLSNRICQSLKRFGAECPDPLPDGKPADIREYFELFVRESEAIIIVYGNTSPTWVTAQELEMRKFLRYREEPPKAMALYNGPPPPKRPIPFKLPGLLTLDGQYAFVEADIRKFFDMVSQGGAAV